MCNLHVSLRSHWEAGMAQLFIYLFYCGEVFKIITWLEDFFIHVIRSDQPRGSLHLASVLTKIKHLFEQDGCKVGFEYNRMEVW